MAASLDFNINKDYIKGLEELVTSSPDFSKQLDAIIWRALGEARKGLQQNALSAIKNGDPHESVRAIRRAVYKKIRGGAVGIVSRGRNTRFQATGQSARTRQINSYQGIDRDFILRFINSGTGDRVGGHGRNTKMDSATLYSHKGKPGWRGRIDPMNFMRQSYVSNALDIVRREVEAIINKKTQ